MADLKLHKVVSSLPGVLEADSIYLVRVGSGYDLYATNHSGTIVSYPLNLPTKASLGLDQVNNTSDAGKPVSTAQQTALNGKVGTSDARLTDAREWTASTVSQAEAEAGVATARRAWTAERVAQAVRGALLTGLSTATSAAIAATDTVLVALGKLQAQVNGKQNALGYTPVQQGTGAGQLGNSVKIGWSASGLLLTVDSTDFANNWPISVSKNAATATKLAASVTINGVAFDGSANITVADSTKLPLAGGTLTGNVFAPSTGVIGDSTSHKGTLQVFGNGTNGAFLVLHRNGIHASYFGVDTDNKLKWGGWSLGNNAYEIWHAQNTPKPSSTVDLTAGAMLINGSWGMGGNAAGGYADANAIPAGSGFFNVNTSPYSNLPSATTHHVIHLQSATVATELGITTNNASASRISLRSFASAAWGAWRELAQLALPNTWTAKQTFNDYTQLGDTAPAIKQKKLTGTTAATEGGSVSVNHGVTSSKVIRVSVLVFHSGTNAILPGWVASAGYQYDVQLTSTGVQVVLHATNSENILSKSFAVVIDYEE
ncbi:hypothetical protein [Pseudomonas sp. DY-1]|uniref:hypothetical protein n=1 Tax=Pseudomonas sp. DY-1 TaxID=1755504 RepID=UPI0015B33A8E|nr:hypothetical protein [Pseudomonas sp. DY-1]